MHSSGRWVPSTATDQFAATRVDWLGVPVERLGTALPNQGNFAQKAAPLLRGRAARGC